MSPKRFNRRPHYETELHKPTENVFTNTGAVNELPKWYRFGILKIILNIMISITIGSMLTKTCARLLEEYDIFKPEDGDDDDDDDA